MTGLVLLAGAGCGAGLWLLLLGLFPRPRRLDRVLTDLYRQPDPIPEDDAVDAGGWAARLGRPGVRALTRAGLPRPGTRRDLAALGKPVPLHLAEQASATAIGLLLPPATALLLALAGIKLGTAVPLWASLAVAAAGFAAPELAVRAEAARHRAGFRHALSAFLDLVVISLAGGSGIDQALDDAASVGTGPAYTELRYALAEARLARVPPWDTLAALGHRVGVAELTQLAATVGLAGTEGAKVRASLRARAAALRTTQLTDTAAEAASATERMSLPIVALFGGFLIFIGYPAVAAVLGGL